MMKVSRIRINSKEENLMTKEALWEKAKALSLLPGVYFMKDHLGSIIYVGKSKALKNRVSSYFAGGKKPQKVERMVRQIEDFEVKITDTELEALLLECRQIKQIKPIYNRMMKGDRKYRYLYFNPQDTRPRVQLVRAQTKEKGMYFGPYEKGETLFRAVQALNESLLLAQCRASEIKENCLVYRRDKCLGMCQEPFNHEGYEASVQKLLGFLLGHEDRLVKEIEAQMQEAASRLDFELAAELKEKWEAILHLRFKKEAMQLAKSHQIVFLKLEKPAGGRKLFMFQSYHMLLSEEIPECPKGAQKLLKKCTQIYKETKLEEEQSLEKSIMDEIYILYSYFKRVGAENYLIFSLIPEKKKMPKDMQKELKKWLYHH